MLFGAACLIACGGSPTAVPTSSSVQRATIAPEQRPTDISNQRPTALETSTGRDLPLEADVLAIYHKTGGFAGIDETLTVYQGGLIELTGRTSGDGKSLKLDEPMIQPLRRMLESQEFAELAPAYRASGADQFTYTISARDRSGNMKTVVAVDGAEYPDFLGQLIAMFNQMRQLIK
jgi:hypothetical protein